MVRATSALGTASVLVSLLLLASSLSVSADSRTIGPGASFEYSKHADSMAYINYSWSVTPAGSTLRFVVIDPDGNTVENVTTDAYDGFQLSLESGTYRFNWTNQGSNSVTLNFNVVSQSTGMDDSERIFDTVFLGLLVGAVVVVIIIVLVIAVVMRGGRSAPPQLKGTPAERAPPGEKPSPYVPGMCPKCGSPFDSRHTFCPKCGHRVR